MAAVLRAPRGGLPPNVPGPGRPGRPPGARLPGARPEPPSEPVPVGRAAPPSRDAPERPAPRGASVPNPREPPEVPPPAGRNPPAPLGLAGDAPRSGAPRADPGLGERSGRCPARFMQVRLPGYRLPFGCLPDAEPMAAPKERQACCLTVPKVMRCNEQSRVGTQNDFTSRNSSRRPPGVSSQALRAAARRCSSTGFGPRSKSNS